MTDTWRLVVYLEGGDALAVYGPRGGLEAAYEEWLESAGGVDGVGPRVVSVEGHSDSYDRAAVRVSALTERVKAMTLERW